MIIRKELSNVNIKKTVYIDKDLIKKLKLKAVMDDSTESKTLNKILAEYFNVKGN